MRLNAQQLRELEVNKVKGELHKVKRNPIYFILENIYDTYNIGGLFRLADALAVSKLYLCGDTEIPPNSRIKKASIGTYKIVDWEYKKTTEKAVLDIRNSILENNKLKLQITNNEYPISIYAVEQHISAIDYRKVDYRLPIVLIFGNESYGVKPETLKLADRIVEIPMWGINKSLNVIVSAAIVSYWIMSRARSENRIRD